MRRAACALLALAACDPSAPDALSPVDASAPDPRDASTPDAAPEPPQGPVGPLDLGMGDVRIGDVATATVSLRNDGPAALHRVTAPEPCPSEGPFCARSQPDVVAEGAVFTFLIEYRPTPSQVGERERAELVVERSRDAPWSIVVDGRGTEGWPVRCFLPPGRSQAPDGCAEVAVRCLNEGRRPLWLTALTVDTEGAASWLDEVPTPERPVRLGDGSSRFDLELCPRGDAPFEAYLRWRAAAQPSQPGGPTTAGASDGITIRPDFPRLVAPEVGVVPVESGVTRVRLENRGTAPLVLWDLEVDEPFEPNPWFRYSGFRPRGVVPSRARVEAGEALELSVHYDFENLPDDAPVQGRLRLRSSDRANPVVVELRTDPAAPPPCALQPPADLDLGTIGPPRRLNPESAQDRRASHAFVIPVENVGDQTCWVTAEVAGFLAEVVRYPRRPEMFDGEAQTSAAFFVPPGAIQRLRIEPRTDLAPGPQEGSIRFEARGLSEPGPTVRVRAEVRADGAAVRVVPDATCGTFDRFTVIVDEAQVQRAALSGALAPFARLSADAALPADGPVTLTVDPESPPGGGPLLLDLETSAGALTVPLALGGSDEPSGRVEHFGTARAEVDVVLVIDDSASMAPRRELLAVNWMDYLQFMEAQALDYRLFLATTSDPTRLVSPDAAELPYVHPRSEPSPGARFAVRLGAIRFEGSGSERVADAVLAAIEAAAPHLRPEAVLTVIAATDERDASATSEADAEAMLPAAKPSWPDDQVTLSVVSGGTEGCAGPGDADPSAEPAPRLVRWTESSRGRRASICTSDFSRQLEDLSGGWSPSYLLFLREQPNIASLAVFVDDVPLPDTEPSGRINWSYDFSNNAVAFSPLAIPPPGARIRVEYDTCR